MYEDIYFKGGQDHPYDRSTSGHSRKGDWAVKAARGVLNNLCDRRDIKRGFEGVDHDVRKEIVDTLAEIIRIAAAPDAKVIHAERQPSDADGAAWNPIATAPKDGTAIIGRTVAEDVFACNWFNDEDEKAGGYWLQYGTDEVRPREWLPMPANSFANASSVTSLSEEVER